MNKTPFATYGLLILNVLIFGWLAFQEQSPWLDRNTDVLAILRFGSNMNPMTLGGEPWRIIVSMFLHFGIFHLLINMFALYSMGGQLEQAIGAERYLLVYFFCGIVSGMSSLLLNVYANSAGASGALFGLYGYRLGAEVLHSFGNRKQLISVILNFAVFVIINALITVQLSVDLWGHVGGCIAGLFLAVMQFRFRLFVRNKHLALVFLPLCLTLFLFPKDQVRYYRLFQHVLHTEQRTNQFYQQQLSDVQLVDSLKSVFNEWDSISASFGQLGKVRKALHHDTATMHHYVSLHKQETGYRLAMIQKESYVYMDSLEYVNAQFDSLPAFQYRLNFNPPQGPIKEEPDTAKAALKTTRIFFDRLWKEIQDPSAASFYRIGQTDSAGRWQGAVRDYFRDGTIQMKGSYKNNMKDGIFLYYSQRGTYLSAGRYTKEESAGKWETYYWNGNLESEIYYDDRTYTRNIWDSLGSPQVVNGNGKITKWHLNGQIAETGLYLNGRKESDWYGYHEDGRAHYREAYHDNRLIRGVAIDLDGKRFVYDELSMYAYPVNGMDNFRKYVEQNIRRPASLNTDSGIVKVVFSVGDDGSVWDFVILEGLGPAYDAEAIRLIKEGPPWRPGLLHGHIKQPSQGFAEILF